MPLAVLPALLQDVGPVSDTFLAAFKDEPIMRFLYPRGVDRDLHVEATAEQWNQDRIVYNYKCVDIDTAKIVGMASWEIYWLPGDENGWKKPQDIPWLEGEEKERCLRILGPMWDVREQLFGNRHHIYLHALAVHPDHQRRGVGSLLVQQGIQIAEQFGLPIYTESSQPAIHLYKSLGFEQLTHVRLIHKAEVLGEDKDSEVPLVVKMPSKAKGLSFREWSERGYDKNYA
ncbi:acyl-CoA N-acyltransferase [Biscogniauxia mediterranea]|nr:acyl-CoA N-acyltransferase [Biscogniauxia mediterranea]